MTLVQFSEPFEKNSKKILGDAGEPAPEDFDD